MNCSTLLKSKIARSKIKILASLFGGAVLWIGMLESQAILCDPDPLGMTPLHVAVQDQDHGSIEKLLLAGADVNAATHYGVRPLAIACTNGDLEAVELLLKAKPDLESRGPNGETPVMIVARQGNIEIMRRLLEAGARAQVVDPANQSALMWGAAAGHLEVVDELIRNGADVHHRLSESGFTPFFLAARHGRAEIVERLVQAGVDVNATMKVDRKGGRSPSDGMSAIVLAVMNGHYELALRLVDLGADPNDQRHGLAPLHLLSDTRKPNSGDGVGGDPPPRGSGKVNGLEFVHEMVKRGADVNLALTTTQSPGKAKLNPSGATPLLYACKTADLALIQTFIELGADIHQPNADGTTPFLAAAGVGMVAVGEEPGTEPEVLQVLETLLGLGADLHTITKENNTAMHGAAFRDFPLVAKFLAEKGLAVKTWNRPNRFGWSPFDIADGKRPGSIKPSAEFRLVLDQLIGEERRQ